jgi:ribosome-binding factor A
MSGIQFHHAHIRENLIREIGWVISNEMRDPRIPPIVSVTDLKLGSDTRNATVYVSVMGDEKVKKGALIALNRAAAYIQKLISGRVSMRHFPVLLFKHDDSIERGTRINELLKEIKDDLV